MQSDLLQVEDDAAVVVVDPLESKNPPNHQNLFHHPRAHQLQMGQTAMVEVLEDLLPPMVVVPAELEFLQVLFLVTASSTEVGAVVSLVVPRLNSSS